MASRPPVPPLRWPGAGSAPAAQAKLAVMAPPPVRWPQGSPVTQAKPAQPSQSPRAALPPEVRRPPRVPPPVVQRAVPAPVAPPPSLVWPGASRPPAATLQRAPVPAAVQTSGVIQMGRGRNRKKSPRKGGMKYMRTRRNSDLVNLENLAHFATQALNQKGLFFQGPVETRGLGRTRVLARVPHRDSSEHTGIFRGMTGGESSSTRYQQDLGTAEDGTRYEILHGMGHGQGGHQTQHARNLASASAGANTVMIPLDNAVTGNTRVSIDTSFRVRQGTERAESIEMRFFHDSYPSEPFFTFHIDGDRPVPTLEEYEDLEELAEPFQDDEILEGSGLLIGLSRSASAWGGVSPNSTHTMGRNHPLGQNPFDPHNGPGGGGFTA